MNNTVRDLAKDLLRPYVERGDSLAAITEGHMGWYCLVYEAHIGGTIWQEIEGERIRRDINRNTLVVTRFERCECFVTFSVEQLMKEILNERSAKQLSLW
jgi:hypothetical protein